MQIAPAASETSKTQPQPLASEVTSALLDAIGTADEIFVTDALRPAFAGYVRALLGPAAELV